MINILLVDDHELVRTGISRIIDDFRGMKVIGEAESGEDAVKWCRSNEPDVILMDINMPVSVDLMQCIRFCALMKILKSLC